MWSLNVEVVFNPLAIGCLQKNGRKYRCAWMQTKILMGCQFCVNLDWVTLTVKYSYTFMRVSNRSFREVQAQRATMIALNWLIASLSWTDWLVTAGLHHMCCKCIFMGHLRTGLAYSVSVESELAVALVCAYRPIPPSLLGAGCSHCTDSSHCPCVCIYTRFL